MLHQKEIVLNAEDTANFLAAIDMVRDIVKIIDIEAMRNSMTNTITPMLGNFNSGETIEQSVHIEASFPAVKDRNEIEEAFNNLVNTASQYANRKTI